MVRFLDPELQWFDVTPEGSSAGGFLLGAHDGTAGVSSDHNRNTNAQLNMKGTAPHS